MLTRLSVCSLGNWAIVCIAGTSLAVLIADDANTGVVLFVATGRQLVLADAEFWYTADDWWIYGDEDVWNGGHCNWDARFGIW